MDGIDAAVVRQFVSFALHFQIDINLAIHQRQPKKKLSLSMPLILQSGIKFIGLIRPIDEDCRLMITASLWYTYQYNKNYIHKWMLPHQILQKNFAAIYLQGS